MSDKETNPEFIDYSIVHQCKIGAIVRIGNRCTEYLGPFQCELNAPHEGQSCKFDSPVGKPAPRVMSDKAICNLCGEPMPEGEEMFNYHGYSGPCPKPPRIEPSEERPVYSKFPQDKPNPEGTQLYGISCNEGWRESIVCTGMFKWAADWLLGVLGRTPYVKEERP